MKVRMEFKIMGSHDGVAYPDKDGTLEVSDGEGAKLCAAGYATPVVEDRAERAVPKKAAEKRG